MLIIIYFVKKKMNNEIKNKKQQNLQSQIEIIEVLQNSELPSID